MIYEPKRLSRWTTPADYFGEVWPDYYRAGVGQNRDSSALERSNFACFLEALGGESETTFVVRESHWAVGWIEWIAIHESDERSLAIADTLAERLENYPILDERHLSELEWTVSADYWDSLAPREKVQFALNERARYHGLVNEPVWIFGRMSYADLARDDSAVACAIFESLRDR